MEEGLLNNIKSLITSLPKNDVKYGRRFIKERNFESLRDLINAVMDEDEQRESKGRVSLIKDYALFADLKNSVDKYCKYLGIYE